LPTVEDFNKIFENEKKTASNKKPNLEISTSCSFELSKRQNNIVTFAENVEIIQKGKEKEYLEDECPTLIEDRTTTKSNKT
jgi:hypothetical protein